MILVDANILLYVEDELNPHHVKARSWWDATLRAFCRVTSCLARRSGSDTVGRA